MNAWRRFVLAAVFLALSGTVIWAEEGKEQRDRRMAWWREAKFGMFIHWGLYALPAGEWHGKVISGTGEWIMFNGKIPVTEYEPIAAQFNPVRFSARQWVSAAKEAGMKYIVITTKHHDGFALFDSKVSAYDVIDATPFKRDIVKELSEECRRQGIVLCWYHSILDWHHPDYLPRGEGSPRPWDIRPKDGASYARYIDYMKSQLRELLTNYGKIGVLWFDGGWEHGPGEHRSEEVVAMVRGLQPDIIINNRIQIPQDFDTPEQYIPATGMPGRDWETCMTMNDTWGYKKDDSNWKSGADLIRKLADVASKGGNFLLNVGPTAEGVIPSPSLTRLAEVGSWMKLNSESIYGTSASPFRKLDWGRATQKPGRLFLHVFDWPSGRLLVPGLSNKATKAYLLSVPGRPLSLERDGEDWAIGIPARAPDPVDSIVVLEIEGKPDVDNSIRPFANGAVHLDATYADIHGVTARFVMGSGLRRMDCIGNWTDLSDWLSWQFRVRRPGHYSVEVDYSTDQAGDGAQLRVELEGQQIAVDLNGSPSPQEFKTVPAGALNFSRAGVFELRVRAAKKTGKSVANLRSVILRPAN